jgi:hypothetical protein
MMHFEDTAASFDADNDGDIDLLVALVVMKIGSG